MTKIESYEQEYRNMNKAYNQIWDSLQVLIEAEDSDARICSAVNSALLVLDEALTAIKDEKTKAQNAQSTTEPVPEEINTNKKDKKDKKEKGFVLKFPGSK